MACHRGQVVAHGGACLHVGRGGGVECLGGGLGQERFENVEGQARAADDAFADGVHVVDEVAGENRREVHLGAAGRVGPHHRVRKTAGEGFDLSSLELPGRQLDLLKAVKATGKPLVVVFIAGKPLAMPWVKENADALLVQWYAGEQQGNSAADILVGNVNPSGRLNVSFPRSTGNSPCYYNYYPTDREFGNDRGGSYEEPALHYIFEKPYALSRIADRVTAKRWCSFMCAT